MKAWRQHNAKQTVKLRELEEELSWYAHRPDHPEALKLRKQIKDTRSYYLLTKTERQGQYSKSVAPISSLMWALLKHGGYKVPEALQS